MVDDHLDQDERDATPVALCTFCGQPLCFCGLCHTWGCGLRSDDVDHDDELEER